MKNLHEKLQHIQATLKAPKGQRNTFGKYNYRSLEDIVEAVKPLLAELGAYILLSDQIVQIGERYYVQARAVLSDGADEIAVLGYAREPLSRKGMDESQITGAASSYARKYAMNGLLAIDDTKDADATNKHEEEETKTKTTNQKETKPTPQAQKKSNAIVEQAFFNYVTEKKDECLEHFEYSKDKFTEAIIKHFKALPTRKNSIKKIIETIKPEEVMVEIPQKGAEE